MQPSTTSVAKVFSQEQIDRVQYFFAKIRMVYGVGKFNATWPTETDLKAVKREWCERISIYDKDAIDSMFEVVKRNMKEDDWPTINYILNCFVRKQEPYKRLSYTNNGSSQVGSLELSKMKEALHINK